MASSDPNTEAMVDTGEEDPAPNGSTTLHEDDLGNHTAIDRLTDRGRCSEDHSAIAAPNSQSVVFNLGHGGPAPAITVSNSKYVNISTGQTVPGTVGEGTLERLLAEARKTFVETDVYRQVKRKLKTFGYVTICGASGEGKTTMALILSSHYRKRGYQVVFVDSIDKFDLDSCLNSAPRIFLIIDDMFGTVGLPTAVPQIKSFLKSLLLHLERCKDALKQIHPMRTDERKQRQDDETNTQDIRVIFTTKSYNFHDGLAQMNFVCFSLFEEQRVVNITLHSLSPAEEQEIYERHKSIAENHSKANLPEYRDLEIPSKLFGFPLVCKLYTFSNNPKKLFKEPLSYLREELTVIIGAWNNRSAVLVLMLLCEGRLQLTKLESDGADQELDEKVNIVTSLIPTATRSGMCQATRRFRGTFFTRGDTVGFAHSSIYDACACIVYGVNPSFVLKHCSDAFLYERVHQEIVRETKVDDYLHLIFISEDYYDIVSVRFANAIRQGKFSKSITHPILRNSKLAEQLLARLTFDETKHTTNDPVDHAWIHQREKGKCFLYWAVLGHNPHLVTHVEIQTGEVLTDDEITEALECCAQTNKLTLLQWLLAKTDGQDLTSTLNSLLLSAAENGSTETLLYLLNAGASLHSSNSMMQNIFHLVCKSQHENTLLALINTQEHKHALNSVDVNGYTPLLVAAKTGSEKCFKQLVPISNMDAEDMNGNSVLHIACHRGNTAIVRQLLPLVIIDKRGMNGWTPIMLAALMGHEKVFDLLESKGANLTLLDTFGDRLIHFACLGGNLPVVERLVSDSNINQKGGNGRTPIMAAAVKGHKCVFDLLESEGADLTLLDTSGDSLLHLACEGGNLPMVEHLVSDSNINQKGGYGRTPIMAAAVWGRKCVFDFLESEGADLTLLDTSGDSLLHLACEGGILPMVEHLVSDSNINQKSGNGRTPIMAAAVWGHKCVFDLLESEGADLTLLDTSGDSLLHLACEGGNLPMVEHLVSDSNINQKSGNGRTPIMAAAVWGRKCVFDFLESEGADLTLLDTSGDSLLHLACEGGNLPMVEHLVSDSNINQKGGYGRTPIMAAAVRGRKCVFDLLESVGADVSVLDTSGDSLLHFACQGGNLHIVEHLVSDSNINQKGGNGRTPIMAAAVWGHKCVFDLLESVGADLTLLDTSGDRLLHLACEGGNVSMVEHLVSDSNINQKSGNGRTPIMAAAVWGRNCVFDLLESKGADLTLLDTSGDNLLHLACEGGNLSIVEYLVSDSNINQKSGYGRTPIMVAAVRGSNCVFDLLESKGADLTLLDTSGDSLLHLACEGGNLAMVEHLVSDLNINLKDGYGRTPVMAAAVRGHKSVFDLLESKGADLTLLDTSGDSLLHLACEGGNLAMVEHLVSDLNINLKDGYGRTPVMAAAVRGHKCVFDLLESKGANLTLLDTSGNRADLTLLDTSGDSLLHLACQGGNMSIVQHLLYHFKINLKGCNGGTPIMAGVVNGHKSVFDLLESKGADLTLLDTSGDSLLHLACLSGNLTLVEQLLSDCKINLRGQMGRTPIMAAAVKGHKSVFDFLESEGADLTLVDTFGDNLFHLACQGGNVAVVEHLLSDSNINLGGQMGRTPIMSAAVNGHKSVFDLLISKGADLSRLDRFGDSLLHFACQSGNIALVEHLMSDSTINLRGNKGRTPIMSAAVNGHKSIFDLLKSKGADLTLLDTLGDSLLHLSCQGGNMSIVQYLLYHFKISLKGCNARTAIMAAAVKGHKSVFDLLELKGADLTLVDTFGDSLLHLACQGGNVAVVEHLLSDSNINLRGQVGRTPIMSAAVNGHKCVFDFLESKGADLSMIDTFGDSLLHIACQGGNITLVHHLVSDSTINLRGNKGRTPIMSAAVNGHKSMFDLLKSKGADLTLLDTHGDSLLHLACQGGSMALVEHLVSDSAINLRGDNGRTPIMAAAVNGHKNVFDLLESEGADITLLDTSGDSLLHLACQGGNLSLVEHLVSDSNTNLRGSNGRTPLMAAAVKGHKDVFDLLESKGADPTLLDSCGNTLLHYGCLGGNTAVVQHIVRLSAREVKTEAHL
ncbi:ankyrin repeat domain-containing protein 17-like [Haliotis asinina]|uniref:ankyrin repeat domain-containing protein 17-like n=1 Tax=Haliotis asinina TaxID=109174 RepID=UPI003532469B